MSDIHIKYKIQNPDFDDFLERMKKVTAELKVMNEYQAEMRWQFGEPEEFEEFVKEMTTATDGWMSSNC